jgi:hypothetical protein
MNSDAIGKVITGIVGVVLFVLYAIGGYKVIADDRYTAKDVVLSLVIFPYPLWVGLKETYLAATSPSETKVPKRTAAVDAVEPASPNSAGATLQKKKELWNLSVDACQEIINISKSKVRSQAEADERRVQVLVALKLAKEFVSATAGDRNLEVDAFRDHYAIGLQAMADGLAANDAEIFKKGAHEVNVFLEILQRRPN